MYTFSNAHQIGQAQLCCEQLLADTLPLSEVCAEAGSLSLSNVCAGADNGCLSDACGGGCRQDGVMGTGCPT